MRNYGEGSFFIKGILLINRFDKELNKISAEPGGGNRFRQNFTGHSFIQAGFTVDTVKGCSPLTITVHNNSLGAINSYHWDFGDGAVRTDNKDTLKHTYAVNAGINPVHYKLLLTVRNASSAGWLDTISTTITVNPKMKVTYTASDYDVCDSTTVKFQAFSSTAVNAYNWDFGDGGISGDQYPAHRFYNPTNKDTFYLVQFTVKSDQYCNGYFSDSITVHPHLDTQFTVNMPGSYDPFSAAIINTSKGGIVSYNWSYGDGTSDNHSQWYIIHTYQDTATNPITCTIRLEIRNSGNCMASLSKDITIPSKKVRNKVVLSLIPKKEYYLKREKIRIGLEAIGLSSESEANLSISVSEADPISNDETSISSYFKDIQTAGWDKNLNCIDFPEIKGVILQGKIINPENRQPMRNTTVFLSSPDSIENLQFTQTNSLGSFRFLLNDYYNNKDVLLRLPNNQKAGFELDNKFEIKEPFKPSVYNLDSRLKQYLLKSQNIVQIQKTYHLEMQKELPVIKTTQELPPFVYSPVVNSIYPADFVKLSDFVEISRELLPSLKIRKHENVYIANMLIENEVQLYFDVPPLIFLDGVPIDDINQIIRLGSEKVKRIETIGSKRYYGNLYFSGILAVFSKTKEINNVVWATPTKFIKPTPIQLFSMPLMPDYSEFGRNPKYMPDFRQLLYWEPNFSLKGSEKKYIEFYASDNAGEFDVKVEGMVTDGIPVSTRIRIKILSNITR